jgi:hypothetical protein
MNKHLDGSKCEGKVRMPLKSEIAEYWEALSSLYFRCVFDPGEPICWACGYFSQRYESTGEGFDKNKDVFSYWNAHKYLERCHILPKVLGGCNCEANLVLLCKECHRESPDTANLELFAKWMANRQSWIHRDIAKMNVAAKELDYQHDVKDYQLFVSDEYIDYLQTNGVEVSGNFSWSTKYACLIQFKEEHPDKVQAIRSRFDRVVSEGVLQDEF